MKKLIITTTLLLANVMAFAQLKVMQNGDIKLGNYSGQTETTTFDSIRTALKIYTKPINWYYPTTTKRSIGIHSLSNDNGTYAEEVGVLGEIRCNGYFDGRGIGVAGVAGNSVSNTNFGVLGHLYGSTPGAAVFGSTSEYYTEHLGKNLSGRWAGYFDGMAKATKGFVGSNLYYCNDYDMQIDNDLLNPLSKLYWLEPVKYKERNEAGNFVGQPIKYGLSETGLQQYFSEALTYDDDYFMYVDYSAFVPVFIAAFKEICDELLTRNVLDYESFANTSDQLQQLQDRFGIARSNRTATNVGNIASERAAVLYQNTPNPFTETTTIRFSLPDNAKSAYIYIFDMQGKMMKQVALSSSEESITINGYELSAGMYLYSLIVDGKEIDTKRMILSK